MGSEEMFFSLISLLIIVSFWSKSSRAISPLLGVSPQEEKYFSAKIIPCKDGTKTFPRDRLNDGFCDCIDGTDEPGTSACPSSKFYCKNAGSISQILFSSRVNDQICDCCDGSDEYDGTITCPNTCSGDGILQNENAKYNSVEKNFNANIVQKNNEMPKEDVIHKLKGLKKEIVVEVVVVFSMMTFCLFRLRIRSRRRLRH